MPEGWLLGGAGDKQMIISTPPAKPQTCYLEYRFYTTLIFIPRTDSVGGGLLSQKVLPMVNSLIFVRSTINTVFGRKCFIEIDFINRTSSICNHE